jgi:hypothetical protein
MIHITNAEYLVLIVAAVLSTLAKIGTWVVQYRQYKLTKAHYHKHHA